MYKNKIASKKDVIIFGIIIFVTLLLSLGIIYCFFYNSDVTKIKDGDGVIEVVSDGDAEILQKKVENSKIEPFFIENKGQGPEEYKYYYQGTDFSVYFTEEGITYQNIYDGQEVVYLQKFVDANPDLILEPRDQNKTKINYFIGGSEEWANDISTYEEIVYKNIYSDIDLVFKFVDGKLKYEFIVYPQADPNKIKFIFEGVDKISLDENGELSILISDSGAVHERPYIYQEIEGSKSTVASSYQINEHSEISFLLGDYDKDVVLIIDPALSTILASTYLGGSGSDYGRGVVVDNSGNVYVAGYTGSADFPTTSTPYSSSYSGGGTDGFVSKFNSDLSELLASTYFGGSEGIDGSFSVSLDSANNVFVAGYTDSNNFPTTTESFDNTLGGYGDVFVVKFDSSLSSLLGSTYVGGSSDEFDEVDYVADILAIDSSDNIYVTGFTGSSDFPTTSTSWDATKNPSYDCFVAKFDNNLSSLAGSSYYGGNGSDLCYGIDIDSGDNVYIVGGTGSSDLLGTAGSYNYPNNGVNVIAKFNSDLSNVVAASEFDQTIGKRVDVQSGFVYTSAAPTMIKMPLDLSSLLASKSISGSNGERSVKVDSNGNVYVGGISVSTGYIYQLDSNLVSITNSNSWAGYGIFYFDLDSNSNFIYTIGSVYTGFTATAGAYDTSANGSQEVFVSKINLKSDPVATTPTFSTFTDGSGYINIFTQVSDADAEDVKLKIEYGSTPCDYTGLGGQPVIINAVASSGSPTTSTDPYQVLGITTASTNNVTSTWDSPSIVTGADGTYCVYVTPNDGTEDGTIVSSTVILDNVAPTQPGALVMNTTSTDSAILNFGSASVDNGGHFSEYKIFYKLGSSGVIESDTAFTSSSDINLDAIDFNSAVTTTISGFTSNTQYVANIWAYDTYGNSTSSASELAFYTLVPSPTNLATTTLSTTTVAFSVDAINNPMSDSSGYYFELTEVGVGVASTSGWIQTNTWSIDTLSSSTDYSVSVKYRNGDAVETATSSLEFTTLTDAAPLADVPTGITSAKDDTNNTSQINVFWSAAINAAGYKVGYQSSSWTTTPASQSDWTTNLYSYISSLSANTTYYFRVMAKNSDGVETAWSDVASATTDNVADVTPPGGGGGGVTLTGTATINNGLTSTENRDVVVKLVSNVATKYYGPVEATYNADTQQFSVCDFTNASQTAIILTKEFNFTLSSTSGPKRLCVKFDNGNGLTLEKTADITLNVTAESLSSVVINNGDESTSNNTVNLKINSEVAVSYDTFEGVHDEQSKQVTCNLASPTWTDFTTPVEKQITLSGSYGIKAVCVILKKADNSTFYISDTINYVQDKKLLLYVPFDEGENADDFVDESSFNWNLECLINCPTSGQTGVKGNSAYFNGVDNQLIIKKPVDLYSEKNLTMIAWVKPDVGADKNGNYKWMRVVNKVLDFELVVRGDTAFHAGIQNAGVFPTGVNPRIFVTSYGKLKIGEWNQIALTYDGKTLRSFVNGELAVEKEREGTITKSLVNSLRIGSYSTNDTDNGSYQFKGFIDEIKIYGSALTGSEIKDNYSENIKTEIPKNNEFLFYAPFDGPTQSESLVDKSKNNWHLECGDSCPTVGQTGIKNNAISFDGDSDSLLVKSPYGMYSEENISVLAWIKPEPNFFGVDTYQYVAGRGTAFELTISDGGILRTGISNVDVVRVVFDTPKVVQMGQWNQIALTYDGKFVRAYANGKLVGQKEQTGAIRNVYDFTVGKLLNRYYYKGLVDDVSVYNYTLSDEEILNNYIEVPQKEYIGPIIFDFEEGEVNFNDKSGKILAICNDVGNSCPESVAGKDGRRGMFFAATSTKRDVIKVLNTKDYPIKNGITAEAWVKPEDSKYYQNMLIIGKGQDNSSFYSYALSIDRRYNRVKAQVKLVNGSEVKLWSDRNSVNMNDWNHVAMSYDGFVLKIFLNGELVKQQSVSPLSATGFHLALVPGAGLQGNDYDITIGADSINRNLFKGTIDYVAFYPYILSDEEIMSHFEEEPTLDTDEDGIEDIYDNCPITPNPDQADFDEDGKGDVCDPCPQENIDDKDEDGFCEGTGFLEPMLGDKDNCPLNSNPNQADGDSDGIGDVCDACVLDPNNDQDGDGLCANVDNCPLNANADQVDSDSDNIGNACDICSADFYNDIDKDGFCADVDVCSFDPNNDADGDGLCANHDACPNDPNNDADGDGICGDVDACPSDPENKCIEEEPCVGPDCEVPCEGPDCNIIPPCEGDSCGDEESGPVEAVIEIITGGISDIIDIIIHPIETIKKVVEKVTEVIKKIIPQAVVETVQKVVVVIQKVIDNPEVERINEKYLAPTVVLAGAANVAVGFQLPIVFNFLRNIFGQPLLLLRRRKQKKWGVIYDSFTKQPVDLATIRVIKDNKVIKTQVSDSQGRYYIILEPGTYQLEVVKPGYLGFSEYLQKADEDAKYINLYHGEDITVKDENTELNYNVPLDSSSQKTSLKDIIRDKTIKVSKFAISLTGLSVSGLSFIISPNPLISSFFFGHMLFFGITYKLAYAKIPTQFGLIADKNTNKPISNALIRIFDAEYNKLVNTMTADKKGRYAVLVGPSKYYLTFEKPGYKLAKSDVIDLSSEKTNGMGGMISENVRMEVKIKD